MAKIKERLFAIAERLKREGFLNEKRAIFFLSFDELKKIADKKLKNSEVIKLIENRMEEWHSFRQASVPDIIYESGQRLSTALPDGKLSMANH